MDNASHKLLRDIVERLANRYIGVQKYQLDDSQNLLHAEVDTNAIQDLLPDLTARHAVGVG